MCTLVLVIVILQIDERESHWLFRRVYGSIYTYTSVAVYMARNVKGTAVTS